MKLRSAHVWSTVWPELSCLGTAERGTGLECFGLCVCTTVVQQTFNCKASTFSGEIPVSIGAWFPNRRRGHHQRHSRCVMSLIQQIRLTGAEMLALWAVPVELSQKNVYVYNKIKGNGQHWKKHNQDVLIFVYHNAIFLQSFQLDNIFSAIHKVTFQIHW